MEQELNEDLEVEATPAPLLVSLEMISVEFLLWR
jgi:hypothetical protein